MSPFDGSPTTLDERIICDQAVLCFNIILHSSSSVYSLSFTLLYRAMVSYACRRKPNLTSQLLWSPCSIAVATVSLMCSYIFEEAHVSYGVAYGIATAAVCAGFEAM